MKKIISQIPVSRIAWIVLITSVTYLGIGWFLYPTFRKGGTSIYWLLTIFTITVLPFIVFCFLAWLASFFMWLTRADKERSRLWSRYTNIFFVSLIVFSISSTVFLFAPFRHLESLYAGSHVYYLSEVYALDEINFQLYKCDSLGFICEGEYRSFDFSNKHVGEAYLVFDKIKKTVNVMHSKEILYSVSAP